MSTTTIYWGVGFVMGWMCCTGLYEVLYIRIRDKLIRSLTAELQKR